MKVLVYANGSSSMGIGHIMRTLAISRELKKRNALITYITDKSDESSINLIKSYGFRVVQIDSILKFLSENNVKKYDVGIVDSYDIEENSILKFYNICKKVVYIDDLMKFKNYNMDILINTSIEALNKNYIGKSKKLLGPKYAILRDEFKDLEYKKLNSKVKNILITLGGGDIDNITKEIIDILLVNYKNMKLNIVLGNSYKYKEFMLENYKYDNVNFYMNVKNMKDLMIENDIAISAGGNTLYELCVCGISTFAVIIADNQKQFVKEIHKKTGMFFIDLTKDSFKSLKNTFSNDLDKFLKNFTLRNQISKEMSKLVDGLGCEKIVGEIIELFK